MASAKGAKKPAALPDISDKNEPEDKQLVALAGYQDLSSAPEPAGILPEPIPEIPDADHGPDRSHEVSPPPSKEITESVTTAAARVRPEAEPAPGLPVMGKKEATRKVAKERKKKGKKTVPPLPLQETAPVKSVPRTAMIAVLAILVLVGGVILVALFLPAPQVNPADTVVTPAITIPPTGVPVLKDTPEVGVRVRVTSPGTYVGTIGNPGFLHQVSGSGDKSYTVLKNDDLVSVSLQKQDYGGDPLTVEIYNNGRLLASRTVTAPTGEIELLINPLTASPPGVTPDITQAANTTGASLTYY
jgi:hypothetical protein